MIYFNDVDVVQKLARCGFLSDLPSLLGIDANQLEVRYLPSLHARIGRKRYEFLGNAARAAIAEFCETHSEVAAGSGRERFKELTQAGMDVGEALLIAESETMEGCFITGDKRALSLYRDHSTTEQRSRVRVICFEMLLLRVYDLRGYAHLRSGCCGALAGNDEDDGLLKLAFSSGELTLESNAISCIESYLAEVRTHSGDIFYDFPRTEQ